MDKKDRYLSSLMTVREVQNFYRTREKCFMSTSVVYVVVSSYIRQDSACGKFRSAVFPLRYPRKYQISSKYM
jgi:hypothetical protein